MDEQLPRVSGVILAGGQSRRMGRNKALVEFDGVPLIAHVFERLRVVCTEVIIVANDASVYASFGVPVIGDVYPGKGSLGGIFSGLQAVCEQQALVVACDMLFLNDALLRYLISLAPTADIVIPRAQDPSSNPAREPQWTHRSKPLPKESNLHPLHAVYSKTCLVPMRERLLKNDLTLNSFYQDVSVRIVEPNEVARFDPEHWSFFNLNTPEDFQIAQDLRRGILKAKNNTPGESG